MDIRSLTVKCPDCAARMRADTAMNRFVCAYCGHVALLSAASGTTGSARQGFHQGNHSGDDDATEERLQAIEQLSALASPIKALELLESRRAEKRAELSHFNTDFARMTSVAGRKMLLLVPGLVFLVIAMLGTSQKDPVAGILIGGFLALLVFVPFYLVYRFRLSRLNAAITKAEAELAAVNRELADHHTRYNYGLIPEGYRHSDALSFILDALGTRRAQTIQHAIYLYEELTQREYVEQSRQTQIGLQNKFNPGSRLHRAETPVSGPNLAQEILKGAAGDAGSAIVANQLRQRK